MFDRFQTLVLVLLMLGTIPVQACDVHVADGWIRESPPGLMTMAGYAVLVNTGGKPVRISAVTSSDFTDIQMHESSVVNGVAVMRPIASLEIGAHQQVAFAPNGKHFMLMGAKKNLKKGDVVTIKLPDQSGCVIEATLLVRALGE